MGVAGSNDYMPESRRSDGPPGLRFVYSFKYGPIFQRELDSGAEIRFDPYELTDEGGVVHIWTEFDGVRGESFSVKVWPEEFPGGTEGFEVENTKLIVVWTI